MIFHANREKIEEYCDVERKRQGIPLPGRKSKDSGAQALSAEQAAEQAADQAAARLGLTALACI